MNVSDTKPVCSDTVQTAATFDTTTSKPRDVRPKTTSTKTTDNASARAPTTTPTYQPPVRSSSAQAQHLTMIDNTGRNIGYMTPTARLVLTDTSAGAPLTPQPMSVGAASPLNPHVPAYNPSLPSQGNDVALRKLIDIKCLPA